jgi:hypothetical protein
MQDGMLAHIEWWNRGLVTLWMKVGRHESREGHTMNQQGMDSI